MSTTVPTTHQPDAGQAADIALAAKALIESGYRIMPLAGKVPVVRGWQRAYTPAAAVLAALRKDSTRNIGLCTGQLTRLADGTPAAPSHALVCVDIDPKHGGRFWLDEPDAEYSTMEARLRAHGPVVARTGSGGLHFYFRHPGGDAHIGNSAGVIAPGVDIRADGGQAVVPPSVHPVTGECYAWEDDELTLTTVPYADIGEFPAFLLKQTKTTSAAERLAAERETASHVFTNAQADRDAYAQFCRRGTQPPPPQGGRNEAAFQQGQYARAYDLDLDLASTICAEHWLPRSKGEQLSRTEFAAAFAHGFQATTTVPIGSKSLATTLASLPDLPGELLSDDQAAQAEAGIAAQRLPEAFAWMARLDKTQSGQWAGHAPNLTRVLLGDPRLTGVFRFNELTAEVEVHGAPWDGPTGHGAMAPLSDTTATKLCVWLHGAYGQAAQPVFAKETAFDVIQMVAEQQCYNPVTTWLDTLTWDGTERLGSLAGRALGDDDDVANMMLRRWLIGAVARAKLPGCQSDAVLVLEGDEGIGKSSFLLDLFDTWRVTIPCPNEHNKVMVAMKCRGAWCAEFSELAGFSTAQQELLKSWVTERADKYRQPYGRVEQTYPRRFVLAATTNESAYLVSRTGNRRWWPLRCRYVDRAVVRADRDQLFAEAYHVFRQWTAAGADPDTAPWVPIPGEYQGLRDRQADRLVTDSQQDLFARFVGRYGVFQWGDWRSFALAESLDWRQRKDDHRLRDMAARAGFVEARLTRAEGQALGRWSTKPVFKLKDPAALAASAGWYRAHSAHHTVATRGPVAPAYEDGDDF